MLCTSTAPPPGRTHARTLPESSCAGVHKPSGQESCFVKRCPKQRKVQWFVSTWQEVMYSHSNLFLSLPFESHLLTYCTFNNR